MLACKMSWVYVSAWIESKIIGLDGVMIFPDMIDQGFAGNNVMANGTLIHLGWVRTGTF